MKWKTTTLGNIASNIQTGPFGSQLHQSDYSEIGTPVVMPKDLINGQITESSIARVDDSHVVRLSKHQIENGDIIYSRRGDVGRCAYATKKEQGWLCGTGCLRVTIDNTKAVSKYVFYQLQKQETIGWVENHAVGSTMLNLNTSILSSVPICVPELLVQERIVNILSAYDDLIENNQKQIKLLEEAAQRLYKEWFVDLRFPGHEHTAIVDGVPEGWKRNNIGDYISYEIGGGWGNEEISNNYENEAYVIRGTDIYGITHGELKNIPFRYHTMSNLKSRILMENDIVFEVSGGSRTEGVARTVLTTNNMLQYFQKPVMCASFCKLIRPKNNNISQYLFQHFKYLRNEKITEKYDKRSASSIVNYRWKDFLVQEVLLLPSAEILDKYNIIANLLYNKIVNCSIQISELRIARDRLLPKLMNGEMEV